MCSGLTPACRTPHLAALPCGQGSTAPLLFLPPLPRSIPRCLWALATPIFLQLRYFPLSLKHGTGVGACGRMHLGIRQDGFFQARGREVPKSSPWHRGKAGYCMHMWQERQAAAKPVAQTLYTCFYGIGFIALLLGIYWNNWRGIKFTVKKEMPFIANFTILIIVW